jgi:hypothetical protein
MYPAPPVTSTFMSQIRSNYRLSCLLAQGLYHAHLFE